MNARLCTVLQLSAWLACVPAIACAQPDTLRHDPFVRPLRAPPQVPAAPASTAGAPIDDPAWQPELRAIMMAGAKSIVNVEGVLVRIGERINGYRLVEVHEETAVFVSGTRRTTLTLRGIQPMRNPTPGQDDRGVARKRDGANQPGEK